MTPWTVACQASLSMGFPRQEYWSGLPTQGSNLGLLHWWEDFFFFFLPLSHQGSSAEGYPGRKRGSQVALFKSHVQTASSAAEME